MIILILTGILFADEPTIIYKDKTEIDFEEVNIEGVNKKPQQALISETSRAIFNPLIKIRTSWGEEMEYSIDQIE